MRPRRNPTVAQYAREEYPFLFAQLVELCRESREDLTTRERIDVNAETGHVLDALAAKLAADRGSLANARAAFVELRDATRRRPFVREVLRGKGAVSERAALMFRSLADALGMFLSERTTNGPRNRALYQAIVRWHFDQRLPLPHFADHKDGFLVVYGLYDEAGDLARVPPGYATNLANVIAQKFGVRYRIKAYGPRLAYLARVAS